MSGMLGNAFYVVLVEYRDDRVKFVVRKDKCTDINHLKAQLCKMCGIPNVNLAKITYFDDDFQSYVNLTSLIYLPNKFRVRIELKQVPNSPSVSRTRPSNQKDIVAVNSPSRNRHSTELVPTQPKVEEIKSLRSTEDSGDRESYLPPDKPSYSALGNAFVTTVDTEHVNKKN